MTDRELLALAAKAEGIEIEWSDVWRSYTRRVLPEPVEPYSKWVLWNPLTDDGDALRLAVKLNLAISIEEGQSWAHSEQVMMGSPVQHDGKDPYKATRRAIVRAAAEIGKAMP